MEQFHDSYLRIGSPGKWDEIINSKWREPFFVALSQLTVIHWDYPFQLFNETCHS